MKEGWHIETISSLCEQMNGIWKGEKEPLTTAKILRTTNFSKDCQMKLDDLAIIEVEQKKMEKRRLKRGDIIVEKSGGGPKQPVGRVILFNIDDDDFSFCNFTSALRIKDQTKILPEFLHKYLTNLYFSGETEKYQSNLVGFRNLDFKGYVSICVKYPSLSEQQRIVSLLDAEFAKIDALKANAEKNLQNAKDLFQAALKKELEPKDGWKRVLMGDVCVLSQGLAINSQTKHLLVEKSELPLLRIKDLRDGTREIFVNEKECPLSCRAYPDDMIYTRTGTLGLIFTGMYGVMHNNCFKIQIDREQIDKFFYMFYVQQASFKNSVLEVAQRAAQPDITHKLFKEQLFSFPSISEQKKIAQILVEVEGKCKILQANYEKTLSLCDDLKQALLRKAFNGEI